MRTIVALLMLAGGSAHADSVLETLLKYEADGGRENAVRMIALLDTATTDSERRLVRSALQLLRGEEALALRALLDSKSTYHRAVGYATIGRLAVPPEELTDALAAALETEKDERLRLLISRALHRLELPAPAAKDRSYRRGERHVPLRDAAVRIEDRLDLMGSRFPEVAVEDLRVCATRVGDEE